MVLSHQLYGLNSEDINRLPKFSASQIDCNKEELLDRIIQFENDFEDCVINADEKAPLFAEFIAFEKNHRTRTTNKMERTDRVKFLSDYLTGAYDGK